MIDIEQQHIHSSRTYSEDVFDGYSAAPLLIVGHDAEQELIDSQDALAEKFEALAHSELDAYVKPSITSFVARSIHSRMHQREGLNGMSYLQRSNTSPDYNKVEYYTKSEIDAACEEMKYGRATPLQVELARQALGMGSVEYANLTIIGGARKQLEPGMWNAVSELVHADATPRADQMYGLQVLGFDRDIRTSAHIGAMRIGMKRHLGETEYGTDVKARTTAIVNLSPSTGVNESLIELFRETAQKDGEIAKLPEFKNAVSWLIETELPKGLVLARNETVYGVVSKEM